MIIAPTIGRIVWYREISSKSVEGPQYFHEQAAIVVHVHSDRMVNLAVFDHNGVPRSKTSVTLRQEGDDDPGCSHCVWMPYQIGQAKKHEIGLGVVRKEIKRFTPFQLITTPFLLELLEWRCWSLLGVAKAKYVEREIFTGDYVFYE